MRTPRARQRLTRIGAWSDDTPTPEPCAGIASKAGDAGHTHVAIRLSIPATQRGGAFIAALADLITVPEFAAIAGEPALPEVEVL